MKNITVILFILLISVSNLFSDDEIHFKERNKEANPEHHNTRKQWLESMHRSEPGVDYKILRREFQNSRMKLNNEIRKNQPKNSPELLRYVSENGKIVGTWKERGSRNQSGRIHTADADLIDGLVYAASAGGNVWRGTINGEGWTCLNNSTQFSISSLKIEHYGNFRRIFVFDHKIMYYSDNDGYTWETPKGLDNIANWGQIIRGIVMRNTEGRKIYILALEWDYTEWKAIKSIYYSSDDGKNFTKLLSVNNTEVIDIWGIEHSRGEFGYENQNGEINLVSDDLYYYHRDSLFTINKSEIELKNIYEDITALNPTRVQLSGTDAENKLHLYITVRSQNSNTPLTYISSDKGESLQERSNLPENYFMNNSFAASKINSDIAYFGGVHCYTTSDAGISWDSINNWWDYYGDPLNKLHADIPGIKSFKTSANTEFFLISTDGGIYKTRDDFSVENISLQNLNVSQYYSIYSYENGNESKIYAGSQDQGYQRSELVTDKILDFEQTVSGDYGSLTSGDGGKSIWTVYPGFAMYYTDAVNSSNNVTWDFNQLSNMKVWMPPIVAVPGKPLTAYIAPGGTASGSSKVWILEFNSSSGELTPYELPYNFNAKEDDNFVTALTISEIDAKFIYALTNKGKFYSSTDGGLTWSETPEFIGPGYNYLHGTSIYASKNELGTVYISGSGYSNPAVFVSNDNGQTFTSLEGLPPAMVYQIDMNTDENVLFAATSLGPYFYIINHEKWYNIAGPDAPDQNYWSVNFLPNKNVVRFATYGRGIWDFEIERLITNVVENNHANDSFLDVFPNPASDVINIRFKGEINNKATVKILDLDGKLISKCFDGIINSDIQELTINLADIAGISSGTYLIIVNSKGMMHYRKINVVR